MQIDIAVKDRRAGPTGWYFATYAYDAHPTGRVAVDEDGAGGADVGQRSRRAADHGILDQSCGAGRMRASIWVSTIV